MSESSNSKMISGDGFRDAMAVNSGLRVLGDAFSVRICSSFGVMKSG